jgi:hypothetical protein
MAKLFFLSYLLIVLTNPLVGQQQQTTESPRNLIRIEVIGTGDNLLGQRFVFKIKEELRKSEVFGLTLDQSIDRLQLRITTVDPLESLSLEGASLTDKITAYSAILLAVSGKNLKPQEYLRHGLSSFGDRRIQDAVELMLIEYTRGEVS